MSPFLEDNKRPCAVQEMVLTIPLTDAAPPGQALETGAQGRSQPTAPERVITVTNAARTGNGAVPQGHRATSMVVCTVAGRQQWATCCHSPVTLMAGLYIAPVHQALMIPSWARSSVCN
jgi:hypothetical protein